MYQQQRTAFAVGDFLAWLDAMAPDEMETITVAMPSGPSIAIVAARIGAVQVAIKPNPSGDPPYDVDIHQHATAEDATECFRHSVDKARAISTEMNRIAAMPPGPEQMMASLELLANTRGQQEPAPVSCLPRRDPGATIREVSTDPPIGLYL
jgi:hypothetical protein